MANKKSIYFDIFARDNSGKAMRGVGKNAKTLGDDLKKVGLAVGVGLAAIAAGAIKVGVDAVQALQRIEVINAQTDAVIKSTGAVANVTRQQVEAMADSLEKLTATEAESIQEGANLLLTFTNIRNGAGANEKVFDRTVRAMVDMGRAMGTDARSAALQLGKAINDPIRGMSQLTRVGVSFTQDQRDLIASLQESGDLFGAQGVLLEALEQQFGGSGAAYAATLSGQMDLLNHNMGETAETIVSNLMPHLQDALEWMNTDGIYMLRDFADWFVEEAVPAIDDFVNAIARMAEDGTLVPNVVAGIAAITAAQWGMNAAMAANPVGLVIAGLVALGALAVAIVANWNDISKVVFQVSGNVMKNIFSVAIGVAAGIQNVINAILLGVGRIVGPVNALARLFGLSGIAVPSSVDFVSRLQTTANQLGQMIDAGALGGVDYLSNGYQTGTTSPARITPGGLTAMATGGIVQPTRGGTPALIGEAGYPEAVIPLTPTALAEYGLGGGQNVFNVTVNGVISSDRSGLMKFIVKGIQDAVKIGDIPRGALVSP